MTTLTSGSSVAEWVHASPGLAVASPEAQTIKLADLIDNTSSIVERDPDFARVYLYEQAELMKVLTKGNPFLYAVAKKNIGAVS
jgi:hypothetical protein